MKKLIGLLQWTLKAAIFFTLFAFALNNQHDVTVHFFFGQQWLAPQVLVLLAVFVLGLVLGVLLMVPKWWREHRQVRRARSAPSTPDKPASKTPNEIEAHGV